MAATPLPSHSVRLRAWFEMSPSLSGVWLVVGSSQFGCFDFPFSARPHLDQGRSMRGVGRSGHSRVAQNFPYSNGRYVTLPVLYKMSCASVPRRTSPTVDQPCPPSPRSEATKAKPKLQEQNLQPPQQHHHQGHSHHGQRRGHHHAGCHQLLRHLVALREQKHIRTNRQPRHHHNHHQWQAA